MILRTKDFRAGFKLKPWWTCFFWFSFGFFFSFSPFLSFSLFSSPSSIFLIDNSRNSAVFHNLIFPVQYWKWQHTRDCGELDKIYLKIWDLIDFLPFLITCLFSFFWGIPELIYFYRKLCANLAISYFSTVSWLRNSGMGFKKLSNVVLLLWLSLTYLKRNKILFSLEIY